MNPEYVPYAVHDMVGRAITQGKRPVALQMHLNLWAAITKEMDGDGLIMPLGPPPILLPYDQQLGEFYALPVFRMWADGVALRYE